MKNPAAFISYSWDDDAHVSWVRDLAARMRADGINVILDQWETAPGDQLPAFMERAIREVDYVLIICIPRYKACSESREGGVGYEGDIMTAEVLTTGNHRKFIPILRAGKWFQAAPSWLCGKYRVDLRGDPYPEYGYDDLLATIYGRRPQAPPVGRVPERFQDKRRARAASAKSSRLGGPIRIVGVVVDDVTEPPLDGTRGSALYRIPFQLSESPSTEWAEVFVGTWNSPPAFTTMHRPGIARVMGDRIILDGTTIEEVEKYHRDTLVLVVDEVNRAIAGRETQRAHEDSARERKSLEHRKNVDDVSKKIRFDE